MFLVGHLYPYCVYNDIIGSIKQLDIFPTAAKTATPHPSSNHQDLGLALEVQVVGLLPRDPILKN